MTGTARPATDLWDRDLDASFCGAQPPGPAVARTEPVALRRPSGPGRRGSPAAHPPTAPAPPTGSPPRPARRRCSFLGQHRQATTRQLLTRDHGRATLRIGLLLRSSASTPDMIEQATSIYREARTSRARWTFVRAKPERHAAQQRAVLGPPHVHRSPAVGRHRPPIHASVFALGGSGGY